MNRTYPFTSPQIMTDDIFTGYGGATGSSTALQRNAAYLSAEEWVSLHINTPIVPAIITGSYYFPHHGRTVQLDWGYLQSVKEVRFIDTEGDAYYTIEGVANTYAAIRNRYRSVIDILTLYGNCQGCGRLYAPYEYEIVYEAGLPTGTYTSPKVLMALTEASQLLLNEFSGHGNEASLVGVVEFSNQEYREKRGKMYDTVFGSSPKAMFIDKLLSGVRKVMVAGL